MAVRVWVVGSIGMVIAALSACSGKAGGSDGPTGGTAGDGAVATGSTTSSGGKPSDAPATTGGSTTTQPIAPGSGGEAVSIGGAGPEPGSAGAPADAGGIAVQYGSQSLHESYGTLQFQVGLSSAPTADVQVDLSSSDPSRVTLFPSSLTFTPQNWAMPQSAVIVGINDVVADGAHEVTIALAPAVSEDARYDGVDAADFSIEVLDDTDVGITVGAQHGATTEAGGTATFNIVLNSQPTAAVTIPLSSNDTSEATVPESVTFQPSEWSKPQMVTVTGVDDQLKDGDQIYEIVLGAAVSTDKSYDGITPPSVQLTNVDDD